MSVENKVAYAKISLIKVTDFFYNYFTGQILMKEFISSMKLND